MYNYIETKYVNSKHLALQLAIDAINVSNAAWPAWISSETDLANKTLIIAKAFHEFLVDSNG